MKRYISLVLVLVLLLAIFPAGAFAASSLKASSKIMDYIKSKEGCELTAYKLQGETYYTIGYGHYGSDVKKGQTITQAQADKLFSDDLKKYENAVNTYNTKYGLKLTQNEFDALVSFTYNVGTGWPEQSWRIARYMKNGFKYDNGDPVPELEIADAFGVISNGGAGLMPGLIVRRMQEAKIFLYGDYAGTGSKDFVYVTLDPAGGTLKSGNKVAVYFKGEPYGTLPEVTKEGYSLVGWKASSGYITGSTVAAKNLALTAVWEEGSSQKEYKLTVSDGSGSGSYKYGTRVYISAVSKPGCSFIGWDSDGVSIVFDAATGAYCVTMPARNVSIKAMYIDGCIFGEYCPTRNYRDIDPLHWAHEGIDFCVSNGIMTGTGENVFSPDDPMTTGMVLTALYRNAGSPDVRGLTCPYSDVIDFEYYGDAAVWAYNCGICPDTDGFGMLRPDDIISREEFASMLYRYADYIGCIDSADKYAELGGFPDSGSIGEPYLDAMRWCVAHNIIIGTDAGTLEPASGATRAQVAVMLLRFMQTCISF